MKKKLNIVLSFQLFLVLSSSTFSQGPGEPYHPMTATSAIGIDNSEHILYWQNPSDVQYNEVYFSNDSSLVANLDTTVRILNGFPSTVYESAPVNPLVQNTRYFCRVVEYNTTGSSISTLWYFYSQPQTTFLYEYYFENDLEGWEVAGPLGFNNWFWFNSSHTGASPGEMAFSWDPVFIGDSYIISPEIPCPAGATILIDVRYYEDWWSDTVVVGCAITLDNGNNWSSIWELQATGNVGPSSFTTNIFPEGNFRLGFYYTGDSNNIDFLYVDDIWLATPLTVAYPPSLLTAQASSTEQKVTLSWDAGVPIGIPVGYRLQRKTGLPSDNSPYVTLTETNYNTFTFDDETVELNNNYTYRISTLNTSHYGNEATAYVPETVPVELQSFTAEVIGSDIKLLWSTATETNNQGFEIRKEESRVRSQESEWLNIGFVEGHGSTTEPQHYTFIDESLKPDKYQYRLKQIDFDGSFEYSNVIEITVDAPIEFSLQQNYPNPFNPVTSIQYVVGSQSYVTVNAFDVLGNDVATLVNENKPPGTYEVEFNATNLPSGIYFYRLKAGNPSTGSGQGFVETKKMLLLK